mmetsp:Transcript_26649/g.67031  ORF Transcript_26649/g.67031 Transcript_26649/m.67031 type:complete len:395 (-) Transcript_26649:363-1547(-)
MRLALVRSITLGRPRKLILSMRASRCAVLPPAPPVPRRSRLRRSCGSVSVALNTNTCGGRRGLAIWSPLAWLASSSGIIGTSCSSWCATCSRCDAWICSSRLSSSANWPCCIMRSASSTTRKVRYLMSSRWRSPPFSRSHKRPGVATTTAGLFRSSRACLLGAMPPTMGTTPMPQLSPTTFRWAHTCIASSRVGAKISARSGLAGNFPTAGPSSSTVPRSSASISRRCMMGIPNARVFPLPVCAAPMMSRRSRVAGSRDSAWTGVGQAKPSLAMAAKTRAWSPKSRHALTSVAASASAASAASAACRSACFCALSARLAALASALPDSRFSLFSVILSRLFSALSAAICFFSSATSPTPPSSPSISSSTGCASPPVGDFFLPTPLVAAFPFPSP